MHLQSDNYWGTESMIKNTVYVFSQDEFVLQHLSQINNEHFVIMGVEDFQKIAALPLGQTVIVDAGLVRWENPLWKKVCEQHRILIASLKPSDVEGQQMLILGAKAYAHAYSAIPQWHQMITHVLKGNVWVGESLLSRLLSQLSSRLSPSIAWQQGLTPREIDVAQRIALGHSNQLIAQDLSITERTVRAHVSSIFNKLGVSDRLALALKVHGIK